MKSVTFYFPVPGWTRRRVYEFLSVRGFGKWAFPRTGGKFLTPRSRETFKFRQKKYLIQEVTVASYQKPKLEGKQLDLLIVDDPFDKTTPEQEAAAQEWLNKTNLVYEDKTARNTSH
jgi:hypothetical protein